jgi:hypothetical protein
MNEKFQRIEIVRDQIADWTKKVVTKLGQQQVDPSMKVDDDDIVSTVASISEIVVNELTKMENQPDFEEFGADFMNDFATDDFVMKNIRVRPVSGVTGDDTKDGRRSSFSKANPTMDGTEDNEGTTYNP